MSDIEPHKYQDDEILFATIYIETECPISQEEKSFEIHLTKQSENLQSSRSKKSLNIASNAYTALMEFFNNGYCVRLKEVVIYIWCEGSNENHAYEQKYKYEDQDGLYVQYGLGWMYTK